MAKRSGNRPVSCERLENRLLFFTYQVTGTSGNDAISISIDEANNRIISAVNGVSDSAVDSLNDRIEISGLGGNDTISITETGDNNVVVDAGTGNDTINLANGANTIDSVDRPVTLNGSGGDDTLVVFSQEQTFDMDLSFFNDIIFWNQSFMVSSDAENVTLNASTRVAQSIEIYDDFAAHTTVIGNAFQTQTITLQQSDADYFPSATSSRSGTIALASMDVDFSQCDVVDFGNCPIVTLVTPNANDNVTLGGTNFTSIAGTSGGVAWADARVSNQTFVTLDLATHDGGVGNDTIVASSAHTSGPLLQIRPGTGTNSFRATNGSWNVVTGALGATLDVTVDSATVNFSNASHTLQSVAIDNGGVLSLAAGGGIITKLLSVTSGSATISVGDAGSVQVLGSGSNFSIGAGRTLFKTGTGILSILSTQSHGANAIFDNWAGVTTFNTDCGTASSRVLNLRATFGTINLSSTQHLKSATADTGLIDMTQNGSRALVAESVTGGASGGAIDLHDNDMIVDYTTAGTAAVARQLLHSGRANGAWNGFGINSSSAASNPGHITTLGSMEATDFKSIYGPTAKFDNETIDNTAVLIKYTWYGDTDFNGRVDGADYARLDAKFNQQTTQGNIGGYINGDFDDNGKLDGADYALIDAAFNSQVGVLRPSGFPSFGTSREIRRA